MNRDLNDNNAHDSAAAREGNGANGNTALVPVLPQSLAVPPNPASQESSGLNYKALLSAFRRRWFLAVSLGLIFGSAAAAAAWYFIPAPFTTFSEIHIRSTGRNFMFKTAEERASFAIYKQNQMKQARGPFVLTAALRDPEVARARMLQEKERPTDWLEQNLAIQNTGTEFFKLSLSGDNPKELKVIVAAITDAYMQEVVARDQAKRRQRLEELKKVLTQEEEQLETKQRSYRETAKGLETANQVQLDQKQQHLLDRNLALRQQIMQVDLEIINMKAQLGILGGDGENVDDIEIPDEVIDAQISGMPEYRELASRVAILKRRVARNREAYTANHPDLIESQQQLEKAENDLNALRKELKPQVASRIGASVSADGALTGTQLEQRIQSLESYKTELEGHLADVRKEVNDHSVFSLQLQALESDIARKASVVQAIADEVSRLEIEIQNAPVGIEVFREAEVPHARDRGKKVKGTVLAGLGTFGLFILGISWLEYRSTRISSLDEVADGLNIRVIGALPNMPRKATKKTNQQSSGRRAFWHSVLTESIDSTRTFLLREAKLDSLQTIMVSSAIGGEGKTTLSCHLATSLARAGRNALLLDCDMRRPSIHKVFDRSSSPGFCEVLRGEATVDEVVQAGPRGGLSILPAGKINQDVLRLLTEDRLSEVFEQLKAKYDFVVVDSAPLLPVTDSLLLAQYIDGVLLSIRKDISRAAKVAAACQRMAMLGVPILGAVAIGLDDGSYGYRYPYRYGYHAYRNGNSAVYGQSVSAAR